MVWDRAKNLHWNWRVVTACFVLALLSLLSPAIRADDMPRLQEAYKKYSGAVTPKNLSDTVYTLAGYGSRVAGYPGDAQAAAYVEQQFKALQLDRVASESFNVTVPYDPVVDENDAGSHKGSYVEWYSNDINSRRVGRGLDQQKMYPLWPDLVRTSMLPKDGLHSPDGQGLNLIYVRDGKLRDFNGKDVDGSVVMVNFNCAAEWMNAPRLGAKAVIFIAPDTTMRGEAEAKFISIPINIPRFYMTQKEAAPLVAACLGGQQPRVSLHCDMPWVTKTARNISGFIQGTDPKFKDQIIVVQAYYDSISVVPALAPGADTACSLAAMLEMIRAFKANPPGRSMMFVATSGHFQALQGIREYVNRHIDEWSPPSVAEAAVASENSSRVGLWLGAFFVLFALAFAGALFAPNANGGGSRWNGLSITMGVSLLVMIVLNAGFYRSPRNVELRKPSSIYLWAGLDLTSQTRSCGVFYKGWFYDFREDIQGRFSDIARVCRENAEKVGNTFGFDSKKVFNDGVNPVDGKNWRNFIAGKPAFDSEAVTVAGGNGITFASTDDSRTFVDTPFDTPDRVNIANLAQQVRLLNCLMWHIVTDTNVPGEVAEHRMPISDPSKWSRMALQGGFATVQGRIQMFDARKSFIANSDPRLINSLAVVRSRTKSFMGVRGNMVQAADGEGNFFAFHGVAPLTAFGTNKATSLAAYHLDYRDTIPDTSAADSTKTIPNPSRGEIDYAPDQGTQGAKYIPLDIMVTTATKETPVVVFRCVTTAIFDLVDQQSLRALSGIDIYDGASDGEPRMYGFAIDPQDPSLVGSYVEDVAVLFSQPGARLKIGMSSGPGATRLLLINSQYDPARPFDKKMKAEGIGYLVAGSAKDRQDAGITGEEKAQITDPASEIARSGAIYDTALHVAEDMWRLDDFRMQRLAKYRILDMKSDDGVPGLHSRALKAIAKANKARAEKDWETFDAASREAWGLESRAYPDVQKTAADVVQGVLFYLALLLPFAYFGERLLFGFFDLKRQLMAASGIFLFIFLIFTQIHPAFDITNSTVIVLLAFIMLALSSIVIGLITGKFEEQLKQMNHSTTGIHKADIGRVSVAVSAFNLGIANMRRRLTRTLLTCTTLVLLTFTVLSFTSVVQTIRFNQVPAPSDKGPRYNGIMIRTAMWEQLQEPAYRTLNDEFGRQNAVAPRAWFFGTQMGEQSFLTLKRADKQYDAKAMCGLAPAEANITRPQDALIQDDKGKPIGRWFLPGDRDVLILPDVIANALRVDPADVGKAKITYSGVEYTVIGILDSQKLKDIADLDNETVTPVDFIAMNKMGNKSGGGAAGGGFKEYTHLEPDAVFFVPYQTATNMGAELRSIAIDFNNPKSVMEKLNPLMHRLGLNLYAGRIDKPDAPDPKMRGTVERFSSIAATSSRGMEAVFFPILIAALIVLNTMLGSVFERVKEIHIFSSIGLAPSHIGMLFIAEAMVYAILGSVAGYILGQLTSKILVLTHWFPDLYLNFSSVSAVMTTLIVVAVVLLSTLYPARKAAEVATPAVERTWRVPEPDGDHWIVPLPFAVSGEQASGLSSFLGEWFAAYEEYSIGDFVTQGVETEEFTHKFGTGYRIKCMTWLAPFDLGVSQRVAIETSPTDTPDVYDIRLVIDRESGDISNWKRVNRRFLNTLRKQFLIWRTLKQADRERYLMGAETAPALTGADIPPLGGAQPATGA